MHLDYHNRRLNATIRHFIGDNPSLIRLEDYVHPTSNMAFHKARVVYTPSGVQDVTYAPYTMRTVKSLRLVTDNTIDYTYKSTDRTALDCLVSQKGDCDDVIIVKNGFLTDTSFTNIALFDGKSWIAPAHPLLCGTKFHWLIDQGEIIPKDIPADTLSQYQAIRLFNAMIEFGEIELPVDEVKLI